MISKNLAAAAALVLVAAMGCSRAESPKEVSHDVRDAQNDAAENVADARKDQADAQMDAEKDVSGEINDAMNVEQENAYEVAIATAEGEAKIAREKCEAMSGDAQKACKDSADATLDLAKANAKAMYPQAD